MGWASGGYCGGGGGGWRGRGRDGWGAVFGGAFIWTWQEGMREDREEEARIKAEVRVHACRSFCRPPRPPSLEGVLQGRAEGDGTPAEEGVIPVAPLTLSHPLGRADVGRARHAHAPGT